MDTRERLIRDVGMVLLESRPDIGWSGRKNWHKDAPTRERLAGMVADRILDDPTLKVRSVEPKGAPAHSCPGGRMPD